MTPEEIRAKLARGAVLSPLEWSILNNATSPQLQGSNTALQGSSPALQVTRNPSGNRQQTIQVASSRPMAGGIPVGPPAPSATPPPVANTGGSKPVITATGRAGSAGAAAPAEQIVVFNGRLYNVLDANQRLKLAQDREAEARAYSDNAFNETVGTLNRSGKQAKTQYEDTLEEILDMERELELTESGNNAAYKRNVDDLTDSFGTGNSARNAFYSAAAPRAFQSSQGTSQEYATGKYNEGVGELAYEKALADDSLILNKGKVGRNRKRVQSAYEEFSTDLTNAFDRAQRGREEYVRGQKDQIVGSLAPLDLSQGITDLSSRYKMEGYDPNRLIDPSLVGAYTPMVGFGQLSGATPAPTQVTAGGTRVRTQTDPTSLYLGAADNAFIRRMLGR